MDKLKQTEKQIKDGDIIRVGKRKFVIVAVPDEDGGVSKTKSGTYRLTFLAQESSNG
jgi:hypothetical protein